MSQPNSGPKPQRAVFRQQQQQQKPQPSGKRKGRKRNKQNNTRVVQSGSNYSQMISARGVADNKMLKRIGISVPRLSNTAMGFFKCAFAPPDFNNTGFAGVPDAFRGKSLVKKHKYVSQQTLTANTDVYYLLLPIPGSAFYSVNAGAVGTAIVQGSVFNAISYSDRASLFGAGSSNTADVVDSFRYLSNHIEIIPTCNATQWGGSITAWKAPIKVQLAGNAGAGLWSITGLQACNAQNPECYTGPFNQGLYAGCFNESSDWSFASVVEGVVNIPNGAPAGGEFGQIATASAFPGYDNNFEALIVKISNPLGSANSCIVKTWSCVEYKVQPGTGLYEYATVSPKEEHNVMALYKEITMSLPVGVSFLDNDTFWQRVLGIVRGLTKAGTALPGPYGMVSGGANMIAEGINSLAF